MSTIEFEEFETHAKLRIGVKGRYNGHQIEVVTGYDICSDSWPVHLYVDGQKPSGVHLDNQHTYEAAIQSGTSAAQRVVDSLSGGQVFQRRIP